MAGAPLETKDLPALARERVQLGPVPDWVSACAYDAEFKPKVTGAITDLLVEQQVHAELQQTYVRVALRLETMEAVQHNAQWRLQLEPQTHSLVLHSIKTRRGGQEREHAALERLQFLQREAGLEGFTIDGWVTLLLLLEDVSPGDILEWSYTRTERPRLLPEYTGRLFTLPADVEVGKYLFSVRHAERRAVRWKSSSAALTPTLTTEAGEVRCLWTGEKFSSPEPEPCTPNWQPTCPWVQVSDCPDWQTVAQGVVEAWGEEPPGEALTKLVAELKASAPEISGRITRAVELVQDEFRYLSVNLEFGGQIPTSAETVLRRRYGDCKDLAFLLARVLRGLGVSARPVLVNAQTCRAVAELLPWPGVFNHVVVEYEVGGERRWVDATLKHQGGGALKRMLPDYGFGLPIAAGTTALVAVPKASLPEGALDVKETFLLDTFGQPSSLAVVMTGTGVYADNLRAELAQGVEAIAKGRLQACANRFSYAARIGQLEYQDKREANEFVTAEVFEINGFLKPDTTPNTCVFVIQSDVVSSLFQPGLKPRLYPLALPFPCNRTHTVEVEFAGLNTAALPPYQVGNEFFSFERRSRALPKFLRLSFAFRTLSEAIPPERVPEHRKLVEPVWRAAVGQLHLPKGYRALRRRSDFGALPRGAAAIASLRPAEANPAPVVPSARAGAVLPPAGTAAEPAQLEAFPSTPHAPRRAEGLVPHKPRPAASPRRRSRAYPQWSNQQCTLGLYFFLASVSLFVLASILDVAHAPAALAGGFGFLGLPVFCCSMVLAIIGLRQCNRYPGRYGRSRTVAIVTLAFGSVIGLFLLLALVSGGQTAIERSRNRTSPLARSRELLHFDPLNFVYQPPGLPWIQVDAQRHGNSTLAFERPGSMIFQLRAQRLASALGETRDELAGRCKKNLERASVSFRLVSEGQVTRNGLAGWQMESAVNLQGHDCYFAEWLLISSGICYQLTVWGPADMAADIKQEADRMFSNFNVVVRQP